MSAAVIILVLLIFLVISGGVAGGAWYYVTYVQSDDKSKDDKSKDDKSGNDSDDKQKACGNGPKDRTCDGYNTGYVDGFRVICPPNFELKPYEGYKNMCISPIKSDNCTWKANNQCDPRDYVIPCYGRWPNNQWGKFKGGATTQGGTVSTGDNIYVTDPVPASAVCS